MLNIRRPHNRLIFNMGIAIPGKDRLYIATGTRTPNYFINTNTVSFRIGSAMKGKFVGYFTITTN